MAVASEGRNSLERRAKGRRMDKAGSSCHTSLQIARAAAADTLFLPDGVSGPQGSEGEEREGF